MLAPDDIKMKIRFWYMAVFLRFMYRTKLRKIWNNLLKWWFDRKHGKSKLPVFIEPQQIWHYLEHRFKYRQDPKSGRLDYSSDPEVFHWRLLDPELADGDCEDIALFFASCVWKIRGVNEVYILSTYYNGGAHATVVYQMWGNWYHFDYGIESITEPMEAPKNVVRRYTKKNKLRQLIGWSFETLDMHPVAINPKRLEK